MSRDAKLVFLSAEKFTCTCMEQIKEIFLQPNIQCTQSMHLIPCKMVEASSTGEFTGKVAVRPVGLCYTHLLQVQVCETTDSRLMQCQKMPGGILTSFTVVLLGKSIIASVIHHYLVNYRSYNTRL